jgi:hypothetical protein
MTVNVDGTIPAEATGITCGFTTNEAVAASWSASKLAPLVEGLLAYQPVLADSILQTYVRKSGQL